MAASIYLPVNKLYEQILIKFSGNVDQVLSQCFFVSSSCATLENLFNIPVLIT